MEIYLTENHKREESVKGALDLKLININTTLFRERRFWISMIILTRLVYVFSSAPMEIKRSGDTVQYYAISQNLLSGGGFSLDGVNPSARRAPGYPLFIAGVYFLLPDHVISVYLFQILFDVLTFILFGNIISLLWKDEKITLIFSVLYTVYYPLMIYSGSILSENLFTLLFSGFIYASVKNFRSPGMVISFVMGLALSAATLVRATPLFMIFMMIPLFYMIKSDLKNMLMNFGIFLTGFFFLLAPWTMRNYVVFDAFLPVTVGTGVQFYDGTHAGYDGTTAARQSAFDEGCSASDESGQFWCDFLETLFVTSLVRRFENGKEEKEGL